VDHLSLDRIFAVLAGDGVVDVDHLAGCRRCRAELDRWRERLAGLRAAEAEALSPAEEHRLRVLFRQLGPSPRRRSLVLRLVRPPELPAPAAARGGSTLLAEFRGGSFAATIQVLPARRPGCYEVHGSLLNEGREVAGGSAALIGGDPPYGDRGTVDAFGEFHFSDVPAGTYALVWDAAGERIELDELTIGDEGGRRES